MNTPVKILALNRAEVSIIWEDNKPDNRTPRDLRLLCNCAFCVHEVSGQKLIEPDSIPEDIRVTDMELIGNYGVRITFSDGHNTGIYRFDSLWDTRTK